MQRFKGCFIAFLALKVCAISGLGRAVLIDADLKTVNKRLRQDVQQAGNVACNVTLLIVKLKRGDLGVAFLTRLTAGCIAPLALRLVRIHRRHGLDFDGANLVAAAV